MGIVLQPDLSKLDSPKNCHIEKERAISLFFSHKSYYFLRVEFGEVCLQVVSRFFLKISLRGKMKNHTQTFKLLCATVFSPICSAHLESLKCHPFLYCHEWFSCLLASAVDDNVCASLWTLYIEKGDAFLIFYMALVLLVNARDQLLAISHPNRFIFILSFSCIHNWSLLYLSTAFLLFFSISYIF